MKKLILAILIAGTFTSAQAQEPKSLLVYGDVGLIDSTSAVPRKGINWDATFGVGFQFNNHWTIGGNIQWGQNATRDSTSYKETENFYRVGPFLRFSHYLNKSEIFFWYAQLDVSYEGGYFTNSNGDPAYHKHTGMYAGLYPALGMNVCRGLCLNFAIGGVNYTTDKSTEAAYSYNTFKFTFGHMVNVGISKNFNTGHKMHVAHQIGDEAIHRDLNVEQDDDAPVRPRRRERGGDNDD